MSRIDELIAEHCPKSVPHRPMGEMGSFVRGNGLQKSDLRTEGVGAIHYGEIHTHYRTWTAATRSFVEPSLAAKLRQANHGDLVIATTSEDDEAVAKATAWLGASPVAVSGDAHIYRHSLDPKYVAYFFQTQSFAEQKHRHLTGAKVRRISGESLAKIVLPVPPLPVQREIVAILDAFTELEAELEAELKARRTQFYWYRDELLKFDTTAERQLAPFGRLATIVRGGSPRPIQAFLTKDVDGVNWIKIGDVPAEGKYVTSTAQRIRPEGVRRSRSVGPGDFILSNSMSFGRPYIVKIDGCIHDGWLAIQDFEASFDANYLYHLLRSGQVAKTLAMQAGSGTVQNLNADIVKGLQLPRVPLEEQRRVAEVLDAFESLVGDIRVGLPAELAARRKQYEYYRDRLLTFPEAS